jgi:hypothetical protein
LGSVHLKTGVEMTRAAKTVVRCRQIGIIEA